MPDDATIAPTHRLHRMKVHEVSLVDRAANKRKFLLLKRDDDMSTKTNVKKEDAATAAAAPPPANDKPADQTGGAAAPSSGSSGAMQQQVKDALKKALADVAEELVNIANAVDSAEVTDQPTDPAVPADVAQQISDASDKLGEIVGQYAKHAAKKPPPAAPAPGTAEEGNPNDPAAKAKTPPPADDGKEMEKSLVDAIDAASKEMTTKKLSPTKNADVFAKMVAKRASISVADAVVAIAKVGRRMAKERMDRLGKAIDMLVGLLKELRYEDQKKRTTTKGEALAKGAAPIAVSPAVSALLEASETLLKTAQTEVATARGIAERAVASLEEMRKTVRPSQAIPNDGAGAPRSVSWDLDMAPRHPAGRRTNTNR